MLGSVGSAAGRLLMPMLSDKIGRRPTDLILFGASLGLSAAFLFAQGWAVVAVYASLTFCYSALAAVLPALPPTCSVCPMPGSTTAFWALPSPLRQTSGGWKPGGKRRGGGLCGHLGAAARPTALPA